MFKGVQNKQFSLLRSENLYSTCSIPRHDMIKSTEIRNKNDNKKINQELYVSEG